MFMQTNVNKLYFSHNKFCFKAKSCPNFSEVGPSWKHLFGVCARLGSDRLQPIVGRPDCRTPGMDPT